MLQAVNHAVGPPVGRLVRLLGLLWLAGVAMRMTLLVVPPVIPLVHEELHMSETQIGLLIGLPLAMFAIAAVPGSLLIARIGAKPALILGMFIAALAGAARGAAIDVWTLYAASIVTGFGIAIMQPGMPTLVRNWLPGRVGLGTVAYSNGMVVGATLPPILTLPLILPWVGGSWRLDFVAWAVPAVVLVAVFALFSPKEQAAADAKFSGGIGTLGRLWWPDWKNPLIWLLGLTFGCNNSPFFGANAFLGDYLATKGETGVLGLALASLNGAQILALGFLIVMADRMQRRAWPFLLFGPVMVAGFLGLIFLPISRGDRRQRRTDRHLYRAYDDTDARLARIAGGAERCAAHGGGHVHHQLHLRDYHSDHLWRAVGRDREAMDNLRAVGALRGGAHSHWRDHRAASSAGWDTDEQTVIAR